MTLQIRVDAADPTPPYEQLRRQISDAIANATLAPGTRLPTVRQLAADLGIAPGTVMRAYSELEASGLLTTNRGSGTIVSLGVRPDPDARLAALASEFVAAARQTGASDERIERAVRTAL